MLDAKLVRERPEEVRRSVERRRLDPDKSNVDRFLEKDREWRQSVSRIEELRRLRNDLSGSIPKLAGEERQSTVERVKQIKTELAALEGGLAALEEERDAALASLPNWLADDVPDGATDEENVERRRWGEPRKMDFEPRDHVELGALTDTIDFEAGARVAGTAFYYLKHEAALLERALLCFATHKLLPKGFVPITTPDLARPAILAGAGYQPRGPATQVYSIENADLALIGTAEITIAGYHLDEIIPAERLPLRYLGFSHCFRTEAGAHGKESRGLYRVHQFTKAEMFVICRPEDSRAHQEEVVANEEEIFRELGIPHRVVDVCAGELGAPAIRKYDLEAWMPGRKTFGEVTSCSDCTDYQARRLGVRFRPAPKETPRFTHLVNGTALAISRALIAIYENYQRADGSIAVPPVLAPWMFGVDLVPVRQS